MAIAYLAVVSILVAAPLAPVAYNRLLYSDSYIIVAGAIVSDDQVDESHAAVVQTKRWPWLPVADHRIRRVSKHDPWLSTAELPRLTSEGTVYLDAGGSKGIFVRADSLGVSTRTYSFRNRRGL